MTTSPKPTDGYVTLKQLLMARSYLEEKWVRRAVAERRFSFFKLDGKLLFDLDDIDSYVSQRRVEAAVVPERSSLQAWEPPVDLNPRARPARTPAEPRPTRTRRRLAGPSPKGT
jgi:hypothetical protein